MEATPERSTPSTAIGTACAEQRKKCSHDSVPVGPSHVPVTSTRVKSWVVQSPRAHPRLKSVSTIKSPSHASLPCAQARVGRCRGEYINESRGEPGARNPRRTWMAKRPGKKPVKQLDLPSAPSPPPTIKVLPTQLQI